jgi:hypothetical protein
MDMSHHAWFIYLDESLCLLSTWNYRCYLQSPAKYIQLKGFWLSSQTTSQRWRLPAPQGCRDCLLLAHLHLWVPSLF